MPLRLPGLRNLDLDLVMVTFKFRERYLCARLVNSIQKPIQCVVVGDRTHRQTGKASHAGSVPHTSCKNEYCSIGVDG